MSAHGQGGTWAYVGLGSNLGDPVAQIAEAVDHLDRTTGISVTARSSLYRSAPLGPVSQPDFVNAAVAVHASLSAQQLLRVMQGVEAAMGRSRDGQLWGPRVIDLDLLVFGDEQIDEPELTVPHPGIVNRNFVLLPLQEIAPGLVIPGIGPVTDIAVNEDEPRIVRID